MARGDIYTVLSGTPNDWHVVKMDKDFDVLETYHVSKAVSVCNCYAGNKETCRHRQMVDLFKAEGKVDSRAAYEFDRKKWVHDPKGEDHG